MIPGGTILHVLDPGAGERERDTLADTDAADVVRALVATLPHYRHRAIVLGTGASGCVPLPLGTQNGRSAPGVLGAGAALRHAPRPQDGRCVVHCYSTRSALGARLAFGARWPIVQSTGAGDGPGTPGVAITALRRRFGIAPPDDSIGHAIAPATGTLPLGTPACMRGEDREGLRAAMGIEPGACVVAALGEPRNATNARWLVFFAGILVAGGLDLTVVVPREARQVARMRRFHATTRLNLRVIVAEEGADVVLGACDVAVARADTHTPDSASVLLWGAVRRAHALGVPVIVRGSGAPPALYAGRMADHLLVPAPTTRRVAKALSTLIRDPALRESLRAEARAGAVATTDDAGLGAGVDRVYRGLLARGRRGSRIRGVA